MIWNLLKVRFAGIANGLVTANGKKKKSKAAVILYGILFLYLIAMMVFFVGLGLWTMTTILKEENRWLYFAYAEIITFALCIITGIFSTQSQIFSAKDNEILLSMPIPTRDILISRICSVMIPDLFFAFVINATAGVIYIVSFGMPILGILSLLISTVLVPMLGFALSALIGWIISLISERLPKKNIISIALFLIFFAAYFYFMMNINAVIREFMVNGNSHAESISKIFPLYHLGRSMSDGNMLSLLIATAFTVIPFLIVVAIINRSFVKIITHKRGEKKSGYVSGREKSRGVMSALIAREFGRLFGSVAYLMNSIVGLFFVIIGVVILIIERDSLYALGQVISGILPIGITAVVCFVISMVTPLASSISLEGKNFWIVRSMPISSEKILFSKLIMHEILVAPIALICSVTVCVIFRTELIEGLVVILLPQLFSLVIGISQLLINLMLPKLDYISEIQVVKQSAAVTVSMFGGMGIALLIALPGVFLLSLIPLYIYGLCCVLLLAAAVIVLAKTLSRYGVRRFERLN
ncbi:MAG: hypothetical protein E7641_06810 [Ruminococcaceae bacterium]|nr:hypothetical protein [Oscillospiraceae bacterium]